MKIQIESIEDTNKSGVYCITNLINGKIYIGSTKNKFKRRYIQHKCGLNTNHHFNIYLQRAYNKYGKDSFIFTILEIVEKGLEKEREQYYLDYYKSYEKEKGYNLEINTLKQEFSQEIKNKISNTLKEGYRSGRIKLQTNHKGKSSWNKGLKCPQIGESRRKMFSSISVYNLNKNLIVKFRSVTDLEEWSRNNEMPELIIGNNNRKGYLLRKDKIYFSIRNNHNYKGLFFKLEEPLLPEMGIANWVNSENAEMLTLSQAGDTSSEGATTTWAIKFA